MQQRCLSFFLLVSATITSCHQCQAFIVPNSSLKGIIAARPKFALLNNQEESTTTDSATNNSSISDNKAAIAQQPKENPYSANNKPASHYDAVICGGGPAGLLTAIMLSQKYGPEHKIAVCERRAAIPPSPSDASVWGDIARFYLLGIGYRGQAALQTFGVHADFVNASVEVKGRRDWQPGMTKLDDGRITLAKKDPPSRVLARDKLVGVLHEHLVQHYIESSSANNISNNNNNNNNNKKANIDLLYGYQVEPLDFGTNDKDPVTIQISKCQDAATINDDAESALESSQDSEKSCDIDETVMVTTNFLIGADGAARTVASAMERSDKERYTALNPFQRLLAKKPFRVTQFDDDNPRVYKSVPILLPSDWPQNLNYSARSRDSRITLEALPSDDQGNLCALLLMKPEDELAQPNADPVKLRQFFDEEFPQFGTLVDHDEMARIALKPSSRLPVFRFAGPQLHLQSRTLVLGDAAHTVKPYYGLGANTALEDVQVLSEILDEAAAAAATTSTSTAGEEKKDVIPKAVQVFSDRRSADAAALVTISRNMDRPGKLFFVNFLIPLILDGIFHKIAPRIFGPNMFAMFQTKGLGFKQIQRKKRLDRALQLVCIGGMLTGAGMVVKTFVGILAKATGQRPTTIFLGCVLQTGLVVTAIKRAATKKKMKEATTSATES